MVDPGMGSGTSPGHGTGARAWFAACWHNFRWLLDTGTNGTPSMFSGCSGAVEVLGAASEVAGTAFLDVLHPAALSATSAISATKVKRFALIIEV
jgi:hypothetical protein